MNREETLAIMGVLKAAYPNYYKDMKRGDAEGIVELWHTMFEDDPAQVVAAAVKAHIASDEKGFPPHIGAIKQAIVKLTKPPELELSEMEAWSLVRKATRNGVYGAQKEFDALPPVIQQVVGSPSQLKEWALMDEDVVASVISSNFQRSYKARAAHAKEMLSLPADVRQTMAQLGAGLSRLEIGGGRDGQV
jgi:hypothetical protein